MAARADAVTRERSSRARSRLGLALIALGLGLAVNSLLGPFVADAFEFHVTETLLNQMIGLDAVSLLVVAPLALIAGLLVRRGHVAGPALAIGIGAYTAYMLVQYILGPDYLRLPGDSQALFPLYLALFVLGWAVALAAPRAADRPDRAPTARRPRLLPLPACAGRCDERRAHRRGLSGRADLLLGNRDDGSRHLPAGHRRRLLRPRPRHLLGPEGALSRRRLVRSHRARGRRDGDHDVRQRRPERLRRRHGADGLHRPSLRGPCSRPLPAALRDAPAHS